MANNILILGASYGSLLGTKLLMAGHNVTLVCREETARLINDKGTEVRIRLKGEDAHRTFRSHDLPGRLDAQTPENVAAGAYDLVGLAMQEPQYSAHSLRTLLIRIAEERIPCLSIMNMPPLPFLRRIPGLDTGKLEAAYSNPRVWDRFEPDLVTLCSPDPQAFRPPEEGANILHVGLPTNFKAARFGDRDANKLLDRLDADIAAVRVGRSEVPVKLRAFDSVFVPLAKWSMLLTGNYRCVERGGVRPIRDAVHENLGKSRLIYQHVDAIARALGADPADAVPFEKYAAAAENLSKPSSVARAVDGGSPVIERVDMLVQLIGRTLGMNSADVDEIVATVDGRLARNQRRSA
ncbi:MAG: hypothetical protein COW30_15235 [Rhodospirillales bacterium CG15_BIG_FIL_POST_REV_8_21_14_020_66_15]|nr:MAG: hypothetical protein COW30_15235 [Rhodospirillales bacterium CG15_BIG_FIL_POST_REV_8_21_14_020_66_15]